MRKTLLIVVGLGIVIVIGVAIKLGLIDLSSTEDFQREEPEIVEVEKQVLVEELNKRITEAQEREADRLEREGEQVKRDYILNGNKEIELEETQRYYDEVGERIIELEKEVGVYWRDPENVKRLIRETFPEDPHTALAIAHCESGFSPDAYNPHNKNGSVDRGLWQINSTHDGKLEAQGLNPFNPEHATEFARQLYEESGWLPWVCYTKHIAKR